MGYVRFAPETGSTTARNAAGLLSHRLADAGQSAAVAGV